MNKLLSLLSIQKAIYFFSFFIVVLYFFWVRSEIYGTIVGKSIIFSVLCIFLAWGLLLLKLFQEKKSFGKFLKESIALKNPLGSLHVGGILLSISWMLVSPFVVPFFLFPDFLSSSWSHGFWDVMSWYIALTLITVYFWGVILLIIHSVYSTLQCRKWYFSEKNMLFWMLSLFGIYILWILIALTHPFSI